MLNNQSSWITGVRMSEIPAFALKKCIEEVDKYACSVVLLLNKSWKIDFIKKIF